MLGKLLHYRSLSAMKFLLPLYGAMTILTGLNIGFFYLLPKGTDFNLPVILFIIFNALYVLGMVAVCLITFCLFLVQFYQNLFSNQGYLTHTLPVSAGSKLAAHLITAVFWLTVGLVLVCLLGTLFLFSIDPGHSRTLVQSVLRAFRTGLAPFRGILLLLIPLYFLGASVIYLRFFTAMTVGASLGGGRHKLLYAIPVYIVIFILRNLLGLATVVLPLSRLAGTDITAQGFLASGTLLIPIFLYLFAAFAIHWIIITFFMKHRLNL